MAGEDEAVKTPPGEQAEQAPGSQGAADQTPTDRAATQPAGEEPPRPGFGERGRMRRRARFLRKARELAYRDLGGLVFDLHRFGQRNDPVVLAKLATLGQIDTELRAIEQALHEFRPVTILREVGIGACPRCAALHGSGDRFCPGCGLVFDAGADRPLSTTPVAPAVKAPETPEAAAAPSGQVSATAGPAGAATAAQTGATPGGAIPSTPTAAQTAPPAVRPTAAPPERPNAPPAVQPNADPPKPPNAPPAVRPTAAPVAARPGASTRDRGGEPDGAGDPNGAEEPGGAGKRAGAGPEDEPTQVLRPPAGNA